MIWIRVSILVLAMHGICVCFSVLNKTMNSTDYLEDEPTHHHPEQQQSLLYQPISVSQSVVVRCSRRYTPGACSVLTSVWTYVYDKRNCVERLGCPICRRTNRFRSYFVCMDRCSTLDAVYEQVLDIEHGGKSLHSPIQAEISIYKAAEDYPFRRHDDIASEDKQDDVTTEDKQDDVSSEDKQDDVSAEDKPDDEDEDEYETQTDEAIDAMEIPPDLYDYADAENNMMNMFG